MEPSRIIKYLVSLLITVSTFSGFLCSLYSFRQKRFNINPLLIAWTLCVLMFICMVYVKNIYEDLLAGRLDLNNAGSVHFYLNVFASVITCISTLKQIKSVKELMNNIPLFETIEYFHINPDAVKTSAVLVIFKAIIFPMAIEITLIVRGARNGEDGYVWSTLYTLYPMVTANYVPNCVFGAFVVCRECTRALNDQVQNIEREANFYQNVKQMVLHKPFYRMQVFCNLSDKLDELSERHLLIGLYSLEYMQQNAMPLLTSLLCNLFGITAGLFQQYYAIADTLINEERYDIFDSLTNGVFLLISFLEIAFLGNLANECTELMHDTSLILNRIQLDNCDIRFRQSVERFSLQNLVTQFKIQPMGLLEIDMSLLHSVFSAVTSFLLILIQSDLTLRFSLK